MTVRRPRINQRARRMMRKGIKILLAKHIKINGGVRRTAGVYMRFCGRVHKKGQSRQKRKMKVGFEPLSNRTIDSAVLVTERMAAF